MKNKQSRRTLKVYRNSKYNNNMKTIFKKNAKVADILITAVSGTLSIGVMLYGVYHFGLANAWPELVLNLFYIACLVMIWMYFFNSPLINTQQFNYWCSISLGMTVLLRDILFSPPMANLALRSVCFTLSVLFLCTLTYFYARREWKIDALIATLYQLDIMYFEAIDEYTNYMLTEIWIRPAITYGLVACFVTETED